MYIYHYFLRLRDIKQLCTVLWIKVLAELRKMKF